MMSGLTPRAAASVAASAAFVLAGAFLSRHADVHIDFEKGYEAAFVDSFHPRERADGKYFRWTTDASFIELRNLPASGRLEVEARLRAVRPQGEPLPLLAFTANGVTVHRVPARPGTAVYTFDFPSPGSRLRLGLESETFEASGGRHLGVQVLALTVRLPHTSPLWRGSALWIALSAVVFCATGLAIGLSPIVSGGAAFVLSAGFVFLTSQGAVRFTAYPRDVLVLASAVFLAAVLSRLLVDRLGWLHEEHRPIAIALLALVLLMKLTIITYPLMSSSDADFQANRFGELLSGNGYPTSVTQHEHAFRIPYPVSLYVVATPLVELGVERVAALKLVIALFDVLVSVLLAFMAWRFLDDLTSGLIAAVLYQLVPMNGLSLSAGNFTNLFGVAMMVVTFCLVLVAAATGNRRAALGAGIGTLFALTAHFGVLLEALVLWPLWLGALWLVPAPVKDERRFLTFAVSMGALVAGLYYLGYRDLFLSQWHRVFEHGPSDGSAVSPLQQLSLNASFLGEQWGWVFVVTAALGGLSLVRRPFSSAFHAAATVWIGVSFLFLAIDLVSSLGIRYSLQVLPLMALLAARYLSGAFERGRLGKMAAIGAGVYLAVQGFRTFYDVLLIRYH